MSRAWLVLVGLAACRQGRDAPAVCRIATRDVPWGPTGVAELDDVARECPPHFDCGEGRSLAAVGGLGADLDGALVCIDARGRYDGPTIGVRRVGERRVFFRGHHEGETPGGAWSCVDTTSGERLELVFDRARWAKVLWGIDVEQLDALTIPRDSETRTIPAPGSVCPTGDWSTHADGTFVAPGLEHLGDLVRAGVVAEVQYTAAPRTAE